MTATDSTQPSWPVSAACCWPVARSHTRTVPSLPPLTALAPSAVTATDSTRPSWPVSLACCWPVARSHTRTVPSSPPLTALVPSAVTATDQHRAVVAGELGLLLAGGQVPHPHRAVARRR